MKFYVFKKKKMFRNRNLNIFIFLELELGLFNEVEKLKMNYLFKSLRYSLFS